MTQFRTLFTLAAATVAALAIPAQADAATANATATAKIVKPLVMTGGGTLGFGQLIVPSAATFSNTFTIQAAATQTGTYCQTGFTCSGTVSAALFNLQGTNNTPLNLTLSEVADSNADGKMDFVLAGGTHDIYVGGSLGVSASDNDGVYTGSFQINADYQ